mmetsp:Transcript_44460/g.73587  ORF Transcript_44460/g.73587 Transcript_44460/m.73587 type:complete len:83 (+) Transcript_44460:405-653(+)
MRDAMNIVYRPSKMRWKIRSHSPEVPMVEDAILASKNASVNVNVHEAHCVHVRGCVRVLATRDILAMAVSGPADTTQHQCHC